MWLAERAGIAATRLRDACAAQVSRGSGRSIALAAAIVTLVATQAISGMLMAVYYQPAWDRAHASVETILTAVPLGWLVRSVHVWGAHLLLIATLVHMGRTFWHERYRKPRELAWILLVLLLGLALAEFATGQLLPMDEAAAAGAPVAVDMAEVVGAGALVRGGSTAGDFMLGRFFVAHTMALPLAGMLLLIAHAAVSLSHGLADAGEPRTGVLECVARGSLLALASVVTLAVALPASLGPAANPLETPAGVKPLWPFLPAYQLLRWLPSAAVAVVGTLGLALLRCAPFVRGRWMRFAIAVGCVLAIALGCAGALIRHP